MKTPITIICAALMLAACAKRPEAIDAAYVSPTTYNGWSCKALASEARRVDVALAGASAQQTRARQNDTVGVILIGLPTSSLSGGNVAPQIAELKGQKVTLEQTQIRKGCL